MSPTSPWGCCSRRGAGSRTATRSSAAAAGLGGEIAIPQILLVAKELEIRGTFRFHSEFALAVDLINWRRVDLAPLLTGSYPLDEAVAAFEAAGDRRRSMKVQLAF
jgi:L-idonate 5-dehydrogenase